ncbi:type I-U CRISPR-associated helicase/endonuclease Cas3 [Micromonospora sp. NPDC050276]|uniref:type I-G CRISPR-associated helicase/endonuclease Cas3g n=1 Tax=Micromonospora sp. NPDC050276 TaxID=3364278 RepID=UPI0037A50EBF
MLSADDFAAFVADVHDGASPSLGAEGTSAVRRTPFPWQRALLDRILRDDRWPDVIDVPTGLGKTSVLDVAVFVAALRPDLARRRMFFVVDRRLVVDEAHEHAMKLRSALAAATGGVLGQVAQVLRAPGDDEGEVLTVTRMRGGVTWDRIWLERPDRFAIVTGTVDQVGSRLLFRGYGVSEHGRSIDAALVGTDSLIIVDEAHLADAFHTTVTDALALDTWSTVRRPALVTMSATTDGGPGGVVHGISAADETHPVAGRRLRARKRLRLVNVAPGRRKGAVDPGEVMADLALRLTRGGGVVGVVTNTVGQARSVFDRIDGQVEAILLTGRIRPIDRDILLDRHYERIRAGRDPADWRPFVIVATQTIEVGANIDLDALVTESASLPALIQRLGRLNRLGRHEVPAPAYVVHDSTVTADDPVYGPARLATWQWLTTHTDAVTPADLDDAGPGINASPAALRELAAAAPADTTAGQRPYVPVLNEATLDAWTRTSPTPHPDPPIAPFLHGIADNPAPVTVIWRTGFAPGASDQWPTVIDFVPPVADEAIDIPLRELRRWLTNNPADEPTAVADIDIAEPPPASPRRGIVTQRRGEARLAPRYHRRGDTALVTPDQIRPGDTIVVPADYGGCDQYGWNPSSTQPVVDVADLASRRGKPVLRIGAHLHQLTAYARRSTVTTDAEHTEPLLSERRGRLDNVLTVAADQPTPLRADTYRDALRYLAEAIPDAEPLHHIITRLLTSTITVTPTRQLNPGTGTAWTPPFPVLLSASTTSGADDDSETGSSSTAYPGRRIGLDPHQRAVAARAAQIATNLGLPDHVVASVWAAGRWHDDGKRDPRFQTMLFAGRRAAAELAIQPLAKSGIDPANRAEARRARAAAAYPPGMRHEALSARIAAHRLTDHPQPVDTALVVHLIASHHGRSRPLLPPITDPQPVKIDVPGLPTLDSADTLDWESPARFAHLNTTYGRWGLALLESILRLADIWCSTRDEEQPE